MKLVALVLPIENAREGHLGSWRVALAEQVGRFMVALPDQSAMAVATGTTGDENAFEPVGEGVRV